jgi:hypothetical protein
MTPPGAGQLRDQYPLHAWSRTCRIAAGELRRAVAATKEFVFYADGDDNTMSVNCQPA